MATHIPSTIVHATLPVETEQVSRLCEGRHFVRFKHLRDLGIVNSWPALRYQMKYNGFPEGRLLGANTRAWTTEEIQKWLDERPINVKKRRRKPEHNGAATGCE